MTRIAAGAESDQRSPQATAVTFATSRVVKKPKQAHNIVAILRAFQAAGWPARIDDPLKRQSSDQTRRSDVENLKKLLLKPLLTFACDGNGTGFLWKKVEKPKAKKASKRRRR